MSQDLAIQQQTTNMLANIKSKMTGAFATLQTEDNLADGIGSSYGIIHYKGKVWSLSYRGNNFIFTRPDDGTQASYIDVVILRQAPNKSKSLYEGYDQDGGSKRPLCASMDGERPDLDVQAPQAVACSVCPRNAWKTDAQGKRSKDCSDYKRVAVLLMPNVTQRMMGVQLLEPIFLRVPAASLADLANYGESLGKAGLAYCSLVTRVSFDPTKAHPQMQFRPLQGLTPAEEPVVLPLRDDNVTKRIVGADQPQRPALPAQLVLPPSSPMNTGFAPQPQNNVVPIHQPQPVHVQPVHVQPQPVHVQPPVIDNEPINTGFGAAPTHAPVPQNGFATSAPLPQSTSVADVGAPMEADADIDSRLAALLPSVN